MKRDWLFQSLLLTGGFFLLTTTPALSEETQKIGLQTNTTADTSLSSEQVSVAQSTRQLRAELPLSNTQKLAQSPARAVVPVTGVKVNSTAQGLELILETSQGEQLQLSKKSQGNAYIADIPNAQLRLSNGQTTFRQDKPIAGISSIQVTNQDSNTIRVTVIGEAGIPTVELFDGDEGLIFGLTPVGSSTQAQQPSSEQPSSGQPSLEQPSSGQPSSEQPSSEQPSSEQPDSNQTPSESTAEGEEEEPIEVVVTATRTEESIQNVPRSVTVIRREQIEQQARIDRNLNDILAKTVPGFGAPTNRSNTFGQTLRGRDISVLIDGVPQNSNLRSIPLELTTIDPSAIERIEVVRGPNAIYGGQATGGTVNIITRRPSTEGISSITDVGLNTSLTHSDDSFGYRLSHQVSGTQGKFDYTLNFSVNTTRGLFDAEGDQIANRVGEDYLTKLNALIKTGVDLTADQRLQFTFNHFQQDQNAKYTVDNGTENIPGIQKARALRLPPGTTVIGATNIDTQKNTLFNLSYTHDNILGSKLNSQVYYRNNVFSGSFPRDDRDGFTGLIISSPGESQQLGGRLQIETPLSRANTLSLLWGVDYLNEKSSQNFDVFDPVEFDTTGGRIYRRIGQRTFVPYYNLDDLGLFAQLQWDINDSLQLSGGLRHVRIGFDVDDYTTFRGRRIQGGARDFDDNVFNVGLVYKPIETISVFANFAQGFSVPNIGAILRLPPTNFVSVNSSIRDIEPQKVNNYEIGVRGQWSNIQASVAGFYNFSSLGSSFQLIDNFLQAVRAPQRVYGIEAAVDVEPTTGWRLGSSVTWTEGENDPTNSGKYQALNSITIPPLKVTAYLENETIKGWRNRLQLLFSGNRDRGFESGTDDAKITSFVTLDYISNIKVGSGEIQIGIQNLLNNQYFPVYSQYFAPFDDTSNYPGQGRTLSIGYRINW